MRTIRPCLVTGPIFRDRLDTGTRSVHNPPMELPPAPIFPERPDQTGATTANKAGPAIELVGGALVTIGSFMPWAGVATVFGTLSVNGTEGDGKITMVIGLVLVLLAILELTGASNTRIAALVLALIAAGVGGYDLVNASDKIADVGNEYARASVGVGLYAVVAGGVLAVVGGFLRR